MSIVLMTDNFLLSEWGVNGSYTVGKASGHTVKNDALYLD